MPRKTIIHNTGPHTFVISRATDEHVYRCVRCKKRCDEIYETQGEHLYLDGASFCWLCVFKLERRFILEMPLVDLPLWINYKWIVSESASRYLERLTTLV